MIFKQIDSEVANPKNIDFRNDLATTVETVEVGETGFKIYTMENNTFNEPEYYILICKREYDSGDIQDVDEDIAIQVLKKLELRKLPIFIYNEDFLPKNVSVPREGIEFVEPIRVQ